MSYYILKNKTPVRVNFSEFSKWIENKENYRVNYTPIDDGVETVDVSTTFLAIDHNWGFGGAPILFETMIFGGEHGGFQRRYCTWEAAEKGHEEACKLVRKKK